MNGKLRNVWVELAFGQVCSYRLANVVVVKGFATGWPLKPQAPGDSSLPRSGAPLNPLEFHGRRRSKWPSQQNAGDRLA